MANTITRSRGDQIINYVAEHLGISIADLALYNRISGADKSNLSAALASDYERITYEIAKTLEAKPDNELSASDRKFMDKLNRFCGDIRYAPAYSIYALRVSIEDLMIDFGYH